MERCTKRSTEDTKKDSKTLLTLQKSTLPLRSLTTTINSARVYVTTTFPNYDDNSARVYVTYLRRGQGGEV